MDMSETEEYVYSVFMCLLLIYLVELYEHRSMCVGASKRTSYVSEVLVQHVSASPPYEFRNLLC